MVKAKHAVETWLNNYGITKKHYHTNDSYFASSLFMQDFDKKKQSKSFCFVNAHFQKNIVKNKIQDLQDTA